MGKVALSSTKCVPLILVFAVFLTGPQVGAVAAGVLAEVAYHGWSVLMKKSLSRSSPYAPLLSAISTVSFVFADSSVSVVGWVFQGLVRWLLESNLIVVSAVPSGTVSAPGSFWPVAIMLASASRES